MCVVLFLTLPLYVTVVPIVLIGTLTGALAFYPVNNRPFSHFLEAIYNHYRRDRLYLWRQKQEVVYKEQFTPTTTIRNPIAVTIPTDQRKDITSLARRLELQAMQKK